MVMNKLVSHLGTREKMPTAFFKMSRSWRNTSFSLRRRASSSPWDLRRPLARKGLGGIFRELSLPAPQHALTDPQVTGSRGNADASFGHQGHRLQLELPAETSSFVCHAKPPDTLYVLFEVSTKSGELSDQHKTKQNNEGSPAWVALSLFPQEHTRDKAAMTSNHETQPHKVQGLGPKWTVEAVADLFEVEASTVRRYAVDYGGVRIRNRWLFFDNLIEQAVRNTYAPANEYAAARPIGSAK